MPGASDLAAPGGPLDLLRRSLAACDGAGVAGVIIGSLALLRHLPAESAAAVRTDDADVMVWVQTDEVLRRLGGVLTGTLGATRVPGKPGKWVRGGRELDVVGRTVPHGFCGEVCFPEPFANVAYLDLVEPDSTLTAALPGLPSSTRVAGALVTCLGKTLKVARYTTLDDWPINKVRRDRAARSLRDVLAVVDNNADAVSVEAAETLLKDAADVHADVHATARRALKVFVRFFGSGGPAYDVAAPDGVTDSMRQAAEQLASGYDRLLGKSAAT